jgi:hypothetical protein
MQRRIPDRVALGIPRSIYEKLQDVTEGSGYRSVNKLVVHVLRDLVANRPSDSSSALSAEEVDLIRQRLRNFGYLD